ncbi:MAG TPA: GDSL-type esterase/lipase family protein [Rariglobus sp.]|jgi:lysophospholipase L1-like esterase|nr:GDSL-type esterase/lipase family protein [Rariglobus sp.]
MKNLLFTVFLSAIAWTSQCVGETPATDPIQLGSLQNSRLQFERTHKGNVAFLGGSITEMEGYRPRVCALLKKRFPDTTFTFTNAGIGSTCSNTGAFRLDHDVLAQGPVDLLVIDFSVNDDQDGHFSRAECIRGLEGIVRHARQANPAMDIVVASFVNDNFLHLYAAGKIPMPIEAHQSVARYYGASTVNIALALSEAIADHRMTWEEYGGVHPHPPGADFCAGVFGQLFDRAWAKPTPPSARVSSYQMPATPLDPFSYSDGRFIDPSNAVVKHGWTLGVPDWNKLPGGKRKQFVSIPMLCATEAGAECTLKFKGNAVGAFVVSGPDSGMAEVSIDGGPVRKVSLRFGPYKVMYYPWTVMLATELKPGEHTLTLRMVSGDKGEGHAMRIAQFVAN